MRAMTIAEKILARASGQSEVRPGEFIVYRPDLIATNDIHGGGRWGPTFKEVGAKSIPNPSRVVVCLDHMVPANTRHAAEVHRLNREWAKQYGIETFYDVGHSGIMHQVLPERGHMRPGMLVVVDDGNGATGGAFGALVIAGAANALPAYVFGEDWLRVPESVAVIVDGELPPGVMIRDLMIKISSELTEHVLTSVVHFLGSTVDRLSIDDRMTMCNVTAQMLTESAIMEPTEDVFAYVRERSSIPFNPVRSDSAAEYAARFEYDLAGLEPYVAAPSTPGNAVKLKEVEGLCIDQAYFGSCASGRLSDLRIMSRIIEGRRVADNCRMVIAPASAEISRKATEEGLMGIFLDAGATIVPAGCGACWGAGAGLVANGEVCITSSTENFKGRMGGHDAQIYLASPASVAASAITGQITDPRRFLRS